MQLAIYYRNKSMCYVRKFPRSQRIIFLRVRSIPRDKLQKKIPHDKCIEKRPAGFIAGFLWSLSRVLRQKRSKPITIILTLEPESPKTRYFNVRD